MDTARLSSSTATGGGLLALALWSTTFALARSVSEQVGALAGAAAIYLSGGFWCLLWLARHRNFDRHLRNLSLRYLLGCGSLFVLYTVLIYVAVGSARDREQLLEVALVNYLWPTGTILLSLPLLGQRARPVLVPGTALALAGVFLVVTQNAGLSWSGFTDGFEQNPTPYLCALAAAISWALYSNLARRWSRPPASGGAVEWFIPVTGLVLLLASGFQTESAVWTQRAAAEAAVLGAITAVAYALWDLAMRKGNLLLVAVCSYSTPLLSTLVSCAYLQVAPSPKLWLGALLIMAGSLVSWWSVSSSENRTRGLRAA